MGDFTTAGEVESVTAHEVINSTAFCYNGEIAIHLIICLMAHSAGTRKL